MKLGVLFSGGKDSCLALTKAMKEHEIACLISIVSKNRESFMFHTPNIWLTRMQAESIDIPLVSVSTEGKKEDELKDLEKAIKEAKQKYSVEGIVTGAVKSNYQASRIKKICEKIRLECINPLWHMDEIKLLNEIVEGDFKAMIISISAEGLDESWLGKILILSDINKLIDLKKKFGINISFEGGEAETLVVDGPIFKHKIVIEEAMKMMENSCTGIYKISKARLS